MQGSGRTVPCTEACVRGQPSRRLARFCHFLRGFHLPAPSELLELELLDELDELFELELLEEFDELLELELLDELDELFELELLDELEELLELELLDELPATRVSCSPAAATVL